MKCQMYIAQLAKFRYNQLKSGKFTENMKENFTFANTFCHVTESYENLFLKSVSGDNHSNKNTCRRKQTCTSYFSTKFPSPSIIHVLPAPWS